MNRNELTAGNNHRKLYTYLALVLVGVSILFCAADAMASATNIYIAQAATGAATGSDCSNALAYTFFNNSANWGSGANQIGPGTTVHVCGTITGSTGTSGLIFRGSGTSGNPVTLLFETGAVLQAPYWGTGYGTVAGAIVISGVSYVTVDGGGTGNAGAGTFVVNGIIQDTLNGTIGGACPGGACTTNHDSVGIALANSSNVVIQNLAIENFYVRTSLSDESGGAWGILKSGTNSSATITNNYFSNQEAHIWWDMSTTGTDPFVTVSNNEFTNFSAGVAEAQGSGGHGVVTTFTVNNNYFHDLAAWNETSSYNYHHDGIHIFDYSIPLTGISIYNNMFAGDFGSGTSWIYYEQYAAGTGAINIFNNVVNSYATQSGNGGGGSRSIEFEGNAITAKVYNNTIIGVVHSGTIMSGIYMNGTTAKPDLQNNIIGGNLEALLEGSMMASTSNKNDYDFSGGSSISINGLGYRASNFSAWQAACSCDSASITLAPNLNGSYVPNSGSPVITAAQNLTSLGMGPLDADKAGIARLSSGNWDIGALSYPSASSGSPHPPSGLTASVQ